MIQYKELLGNRLQFNIQNAITNDIARRKEFKCSLPFIDKCAFYSLYVDAIRIFQRKIRESSSKNWIEDIIEIVIPIGWITSPRRYYEVIAGWCQKYFPKGNYAIEMITSLVDEYGSISSTPGPRFQAFCNKPIPICQIYKAHRHIQYVIEMGNNNTYSKKLHIKMLDHLKDVYFFGQLSPQHIISILTLLRIIVPVGFLNNAYVATKTRTSSRFCKSYGLNDDTMNYLYHELSKQFFPGQTQMMENMGCEFLEIVSIIMKFHLEFLKRIMRNV